MVRRTRRTDRRSYPKPVYRRPVRLRSKVKSARAEQAASAVLWVVLIALLGFGGWWGYRKAQHVLFTADCFTIRAIEVRGGKNVSQSEIIALLPFRPGDNMWKVLLGAAEKDVQQSKPELRRISMHRRWKKIVVSIQERAPIGFVMDNGEKQGIDIDNVPFPLRGAWITASLPEVVAATSADRREVLNFMADFAPVSKDFFGTIARFAIEPVNSIIFDLKNGPRVYWGRLENDKLNAKLSRLGQVLDDARARYANGLAYVNLSYFDDGRVLVMPLKTPAAPVPAAPLKRNTR